MKRGTSYHTRADASNLKSLLAVHSAIITAGALGAFAQSAKRDDLGDNWREVALRGGDEAGDLVTVEK